MAKCQSARNVVVSVGAGRNIWLLAREAGNLSILTSPSQCQHFLIFFFLQCWRLNPRTEGCKTNALLLGCALIPHRRILISFGFLAKFPVRDFSPEATKPFISVLY